MRRDDRRRLHRRRAARTVTRRDERGPELGDGREAILRIDREGAPTDSLDLVGDVGAARPRRRPLVRVGRRPHDADDVPLVDRPPIREELGHEEREGVHVRREPRRADAWIELFGRRIEPGEGREGPLRPGRLTLLHDLGDPEIEHLHLRPGPALRLPGEEEDVRRLHVAMRDLLHVCRGQTIGDGLEDREGLGE